jgi:hypothetical protein
MSEAVAALTEEQTRQRYRDAVGEEAARWRSASGGGPLRLLPMLHTLGQLEPLAALVGLGEAGRPLLLHLRQELSWHLLVIGKEACGKSELLRSTLISLALTNRRASLQVLGIDIGGQELMVADALPHAITDLATHAPFALQIIDWLAEEVRRRAASGIVRPDILLFIDDLGWLAGPGAAKGAHALCGILQTGRQAGVHVLAAGRNMPGGLLGEAFRAPGIVRVIPAGAGPAVGRRPGCFIFRSEGKRGLVRCAWLSARDLDAAVRLIDAGWRPMGDCLWSTGMARVV